MHEEVVDVHVAPPGVAVITYGNPGSLVHVALTWRWPAVIVTLPKSSGLTAANNLFGVSWERVGKAA